jgi:dTDP-4-dehydrorhamnose reductase
LVIRCCQTLAQACAATGIAWGHVSSGCIFTGAKVESDGQLRVEPDLTKPALRRIVEQSPARIHGFTETDEPNFSFRRGPCSFYSGTKALGEEAIAGIGQSYVWRLRIPFDEFDSTRNYLSKCSASRYTAQSSHVATLRARPELGAPARFHLQRTNPARDHVRSSG